MKRHKKIPNFEEAQDELGEGAMSFFMDMVRQESSDEEPEELAIEQNQKDGGRHERQS